MSSEIPWSAVFLLLVDCATILFWFFLDNAKKRRRPHKKEIFICGDCWLLVFDFLAPSQLGLEIALVSRRFDCIVDEHFKTRMCLNSIIRLHLNTVAFRRLRQLDPAMLTNYQSHSFFYNDDLLLAFLPDDSANASDGQAVTKWLFTPCPDGVPKWLKCFVNAPVDQWSSMMEQLKAAFSNASSTIVFRIYFWFRPSFPIDSVVPFDLINEFTGEQLTLEQKGNVFLLSRCPIAWDVKKWKNLVKEVFAQRNSILFLVRDGGFDDGLFNAASSPGSRGQQQQQK